MNEVRLKQEVAPVITRASNMIITSADDYAEAADFLKAVKSAQKKVDITLLEPLREAKRGIQKGWDRIKKEFVDPLASAEKTAKRKMLAYQQEEERKRLEEERRLQAEAEEKARKERERLAKQAAKLKTPELREQRMAEAEAIEAPVVTVAKETPKVKGISVKKVWKAKIVDKVAFVRAALDNPNIMAFIKIDEGKLNKLAQATKGEISYPGAKMYEEPIMAAGGK